jgi:hypothetical protein
VTAACAGVTAPPSGPSVARSKVSVASPALVIVALNAQTLRRI